MFVLKGDQPDGDLDWELASTIQARFQGESAKLPKLPYRFRSKVRPLHRRITIKHPTGSSRQQSN